MQHIYIYIYVCARIRIIMKYSEIMQSHYAMSPYMTYMHAYVHAYMHT